MREGYRVETGPGWELRLGDCLCPETGLPSLPDRSVDHVITDPPYNARTHASAVCGRTDSVTGVAFAPLSDPATLAVEMLRPARRWVVAFCAVEDFGAYATGAANWWVRGGVWDKVNPTPQLTGDRPGQAVEGLAIMHSGYKRRWNRGGGAAIWRHASPRGGDRPDHPTPKPLALMEALVSDFTDPGELVCDPFAGSGTTGVACIRLGRRFLGWEKDPKYFDAAVKRLRAAREQFRLPGLDATPAKQEPLALAPSRDVGVE